MKTPLLLSSRMLLAAVTLFPVTTFAERTLLPRGAATTWQYLDGGKQPEGDWKSPAFDSAAWKSGPAPLGYGEDKLGTEISFGGNARNKAMTTWFRAAVEIPEPDKVESLLLQLRRDDGAVVYLNGKEVARSNMPAGPVKTDTAASTALRDDVEGIYHRFTVPAQATLLKGRNVIAVEVHQAEPQSSDLIFDLEVTAYGPGETPKADAFAEAQAALDAGDMAAALPLLLKVDTAQPGSAEFLARAARTWLQNVRRPDDGFFALMEKAVTAAPDDMELVYGYIRARVAARRDLPVKPQRRELPKEVPAEFKFIAASPLVGNDTGRKLSREDALADVDDLELILENCYAYLDRRGADWRGALDALRVSISGPVSAAVFQYRVARVLTVFGDPHSRLTVRPLPEPGAPVRFVMAGDRLAALSPSRELLDAVHPYVSDINGVPAARWIEAAEQIVPQASPQYRRHMALEQMRALPVLARELDKPGESFSFTLEDEGGTKKTARTLKPAVRRGSGGDTWPDRKSEVRADGIGYLRIPEMDSSDEFIQSLNDWMKKFSGTRGLIIDVRGNGGGSQDALKTIMPWLMKPSDPMKIVNVAAYRLPVSLPKPNRSGFLGLYGRGLHPATSAEWSPSEAAQIRAFLATWKPQWTLPAGKFSDWHVMAIGHRTNPSAGTYDKPVIVLQNEECFSATDNFLGALKGHPGVTLMGTVSGGGSGRMADYQLPNSRLSLTLCQMASFSAGGYTYDGNGVPPDVTAAPILTDHLRGGTDTVLDAAVKRLSAP